MSGSSVDSESDDDEEEENSVLKRAGNLLTGKSDNLPHGFLDIARTKDANIDKPSNVSAEIVKCLQFVKKISRLTRHQFFSSDYR